MSHFPVKIFSFPYFLISCLTGRNSETDYRCCNSQSWISLVHLFKKFTVQELQPRVQDDRVLRVLAEWGNDMCVIQYECLHTKLPVVLKYPSRTTTEFWWPYLTCQNCARKEILAAVLHVCQASEYLGRNNYVSFSEKYILHVLYR